MIMFESRDHNERSTTKPGAGCGIRLTVLLPHDYDIDTYYSGLRPIQDCAANRFPSRARLETDFGETETLQSVILTSIT